MTAKAMSTALVIVTTAVVIMVVALIVLLVFTGGIGSFQQIFGLWSGNTALTAECQTVCQQLCAGFIRELPAKCAGHTCDCNAPIGGCAKSGESCSTLKQCCAPLTCDQATKTCK